MLSQAAIVIATSLRKGGTWSGAIENLKAGWVPVWVKQAEQSKAAHSELVKYGAHWLPQTEIRFAALADPMSYHSDKQAPTFFDLDQAVGSDHQQPLVPHVNHFLTEKLDLYQVFLMLFGKLTREKPMSIDDLGASLDLTQKQVQLWLKRAIEEGHAIKKGRPVRYQVAR